MSIFSGWTLEDLHLLKEALLAPEGLGYLALFALIGIAGITLVVRLILKSVTGFTMKIQEEEALEEEMPDAGKETGGGDA